MTIRRVANLIRSVRRRHFCFLTVLILSGSYPAAMADVVIYFDREAFNAATGNRAEAFPTNAENILLADEVDSLPGPDTTVGNVKNPGEGRTLTFNRENTGLRYSFEFTSLQDIENSLTFDDDEQAGNLADWDDALSPGDIGDGQNDDWRIRVLNPQDPLQAFGFELRANTESAGESIRLVRVDGTLILEIPLPSRTSNTFLGLVSDLPFSEIRFDEDPGVDEIAVADFLFVPIANSTPTAVDVFAATLVNTVQSPQSTIVVLAGSDIDGDSLVYTLGTSPANGTLRDPNNGNAIVTQGSIAGNTLLYTPDVDFIGTDHFTYSVSDGASESDIKVATISVFESFRAQALQLGSDINGETTVERLGEGLALSSDGRTLAISGRKSDDVFGSQGSMQIYRWNGTAWSQLGNDIDGPLSTAVSLSGDGETVAIASISDDDNGDLVSLVRMYRWDGTVWMQLGSDIASAGNAVYSVSLSSDGMTVAFGTPSKFSNGPFSGQTRMYRWNGTAWVQLGTDIDGEAFDESGDSVSLSSDGQTVAIAAPLGSNFPSTGLTRIFRWNGVSWEQMGGDIAGKPRTEFSSYGVSLSNDGKTVAVGVADDFGGLARVYRWSGAAWLQIGTDGDLEAGTDLSDGQIKTVSLAGNGSTVAIGWFTRSDNGSGASTTRIYHWNGTAWLKVVGEISTGLGNNPSIFRESESLSGDGQTIAIGSPFSMEPSGVVRVYDLTLSAEEDDDGDNVINKTDACDSTPSAEVDLIDASGCAPSERDTDNDGTNDAFDAFPDDPTESADRDGDGLGDNREAVLGTNPNLVDTDGDGLSDLEEVENGSDPLFDEDNPGNGGLSIPLIKAIIDTKVN